MWVSIKGGTLSRAELSIIATEFGINAMDSKQRTMLHWAVSNGHSELAQLLLDSGADPNTQMSSGWTPLHQAAYNNKPECCRVLVENGASMQATNKQGKTAADEAKPALKGLLHELMSGAGREIF